MRRVPGTDTREKCTKQVKIPAGGMSRPGRRADSTNDVKEPRRPPICNHYSTEELMSANPQSRVVSAEGDDAGAS